MRSNEKRIDGDQHYATFELDESYSDGTFEIHRKSDGVEVAKWFHGEDGPRPDAESALKEFDETAKHFTALAIQGERERVNGLAAELADHTQDLTASSPGQNTPLWTVYGLHDVEEGTTGDTFLEALEAAANPKEES